MVQFFDRGKKRPLRRKGADVQFINDRRCQRRRIPEAIGPLKGILIHEARQLMDAVRLRRRARIGKRAFVVGHESITVAGLGGRNLGGPPAIGFRCHRIIVTVEMQGDLFWQRRPNAKCVHKIRGTGILPVWLEPAIHRGHPAQKRTGKMPVPLSSRGQQCHRKFSK